MGSLRSLLRERKVNGLTSLLRDACLENIILDYMMTSRHYQLSYHKNKVALFGASPVHKITGLDVCNIEILIKEGKIGVRFFLLDYTRMDIKGIAGFVYNYPEGAGICFLGHSVKFNLTDRIIYDDYPNFKEKMGKYLVRAIREFTGTKEKVLI